MFHFARPLLVRNASAKSLIEYFWIAAMVTVFSIRIFLYLTGFPQLGGSQFHIAHMLWGGLFMAAAILLMISFLNQHVRKIGAIVGGVGFGTFIDELGKFITHDNNYFFQPTVLLIYLIFVGLFFLARQIELWFPLSDREYLVNSLELIKDAAMHDLDVSEKKLAEKYLRKSKASGELATSLLATLQTVKPVPLQAERKLRHIQRQLTTLYSQLVRNSSFGKMIILIYTFATLDNFLVLLPHLTVITFTEWGLSISTLLSMLFIIQGGVFFNKGKRLAGFESLKSATLVSIFLVQLFLFYQEQLSAAVELVGAVISLQVLQLLIAQEKQLPKAPVPTITS